jgi:hypothetical protein
MYTALSDSSNIARLITYSFTLLSQSKEKVAQISSLEDSKDRLSSPLSSVGLLPSIPIKYCRVPSMVAVVFAS